MTRTLAILGKAALFSLSILTGAFSFLSWLLRAPFPPLIDPRDRERLTQWVGVAEPEMQPHWRRYFRRWWSIHELNNIGSEWARLDPQRAFKFLSFYVVLYLGALIALFFAVPWEVLL